MVNSLKITFLHQQKKLVKNIFSFLSEYDEETEAWFFSVLLFSRPSLAVCLPFQHLPIVRKHICYPRTRYKIRRRSKGLY